MTRARRLLKKVTRGDAIVDRLGRESPAMRRGVAVEAEGHG